MKAVLFDLDGVIVDTAPFHFIAWAQVAKELEITIDEAFNEQLKGISREQSLQRILDYGKVELDTSAFAAIMEQKNIHYVTLLKNLDASYILPGIADLLQELHDNGIKIGLASASKNAPLIIAKLQLEQYFDCIAPPDDLPSKPAPDIFMNGAQLLDIQPNEIVGIEDASAGVAAIKAAHMVAIGIGDADILAGADSVLSSTAVLTMVKIYEVWQNYHAQ